MSNYHILSKKIIIKVLFFSAVCVWVVMTTDLSPGISWSNINLWRHHVLNWSITVTLATLSSFTWAANRWPMDKVQMFRNMYCPLVLGFWKRVFYCISLLTNTPVECVLRVTTTNTCLSTCWWCFFCRWSYLKTELKHWTLCLYFWGLSSQLSLYLLSSLLIIS